MAQTFTHLLAHLILSTKVFLRPCGAYAGGRTAQSCSISREGAMGGRFGIDGSALFF